MSAKTEPKTKAKADKPAKVDRPMVGAIAKMQAMSEDERKAWAQKMHASKKSPEERIKANQDKLAKIYADYGPRIEKIEKRLDDLITARQEAIDKVQKLIDRDQRLLNGGSEAEAMAALAEKTPEELQEELRRLQRVTRILRQKPQLAQAMLDSAPVTQSDEP